MTNTKQYVFGINLENGSDHRVFLAGSEQAVLHALRVNVAQLCTLHSTTCGSVDVCYYNPAYGFEWDSIDYTHHTGLQHVPSLSGAALGILCGTVESEV